MYAWNLGKKIIYSIQVGSMYIYMINIRLISIFSKNGKALLYQIIEL